MTPSSPGLGGLLAKARGLVAPLLQPKPVSPHNTKPQDASPLCGRRLPPELRQLIWKAYFSEHAVHMYISRSRLRAYECVKLGADRTLPPLDRHVACNRANAQCDHMSLLLTCKQIYFECIRILYNETFFDFSIGPESLPLVVERIPVSHVSQISTVNLFVDFPRPLYLKKRNIGKHEILWVDIWNALAALDGLVWLRFELRIYLPHLAEEWTTIEWSFWELVRKVRPRHFELILPFPAAASTRPETLPCTITRRT